MGSYGAPPPEEPGAQHPPLPPPDEPDKVRLLWWPFAVAALAVVVAVVIVAIALGGDDGGTPGSTTGSTVAPTAAPDLGASTTTIGAASGTTAPVDDGSWTVLVYFLADNNLEAAALADLQEMTEIPASPSLHLVALVDRAEGFTDDGFGVVGNWETAKVLDVGAGGVTEVVDLGEANLGDPSVLISFVADGIARHPAEHYALVLWDHGSIAGVGGDHSHDDGLTLPEIASALEAALEQAGMERFDLLGFDACLMGAVEVAHWMAPYADYLIASENLVPNSGWDYRSLGYVTEYPAAAPEDLGREIITSFVATHGETRPNVTMSLVDLQAFGVFEARLDDLASFVIPQMDVFAAVIGRERSKVITFASSPVPEDDPFMIDLGQLITRIGGADEALTAVAGAAGDSLEAAVVMSGTGPAVTGASGMAAYFPPYETLYAEGYPNIAPEAWSGIIEAYYAAGEAIPPGEQPSFAGVDGEATAEFTSIGLTVSASFDDTAVDNIVEAVLYTGIVQEDGSVLFVGEDQGLFEGSLVLANYDLTTLVLSDGTDEALAYQDVWFSPDMSIITLDVPVAYVPPGAPEGEYQDLLLSIQYDVTADVLGAGFFAYDEAGTIGEITPDPQGLIFPWLLVADTDGTAEWTTLTEAGLWADPALLTFEYVPLPTGIEVYSELTVFDYGGNSDFAAVTVTVP